AAENGERVAAHETLDGARRVGGRERAFAQTLELASSESPAAKERTPPPVERKSDAYENQNGECPPPGRDRPPAGGRCMFRRDVGEPVVVHAAALGALSNSESACSTRCAVSS